MAISFVAAAAGAFSSSAGGTISDPAGVQDDDIVLAIWQTDSSHDSSGTPPTGWAKIVEQDATTDTTTSVFWKRVAAGTSNNFANIFAASESGHYITLAYRGCVTSGDPQDATAVSGTFGASTAWDTPAIVTVTANAMVIGIFGTDPAANPQTFAWDLGIDERIDSGTTPSGQNALLSYTAIGDKIQVSPGSITLGGDSDTSDAGVEIILALKPAETVTYVPRHSAHDHANPAVF